MLEDKQTYELSELFELLPMTLSELARKSEINEVTLARMRDGKRTRRDTVNKLLIQFSKVYDRPLSIRNVTGINLMINRRKQAKEEGLVKPVGRPRKEESKEETQEQAPKNDVAA